MPCSLRMLLAVLAFCGKPARIHGLCQGPTNVILRRASVGAAEDLGCRARIAVLNDVVRFPLGHEEFLAVVAVAPGLLLDEVEGGSDPGVRAAGSIGIVGVRLPVAVVVGVVIDGHARAVDGEDVVADGVQLLGQGRLAGLLAEPVGVGQGLGGVELAAVGGADESPGPWTCRPGWR